MSSGLLVILVCHAEYEAKHIVACDFTNEIVFPALKLAKSCQTVNIVHLSEQKVIFYRASFTSPCGTRHYGSSPRHPSLLNEGLTWSDRRTPPTYRAVDVPLVPHPR